MEATNKVTRADVIREARILYIMKRGSAGLCQCLYDSIVWIFALPIPAHCQKNCGEFVNVFIPKFEPPKGKTFCDYWWPLEDTDSRLAFLDYLAEEYKDDDEDLRSIKIE